MPTIRIALANARLPSPREESLKIVLETMTDASAGAAVIICFPECFVPGYRIGAGNSTPEQDWLNQAWSLIDAKAAELGINVILGTERIEADGLFITARVTNADGTFAGFQDKVQLDPSEESTYAPGLGRLFEMYEVPNRSQIGFSRRLLGNLTKQVKIYFVVKPFQFIFPTKPYEQQLAYMRSLPRHTVGHDLARMLDSKALKLIPGFEKHDLNHLILGYDMDPEEELCMQAYLVGNGHWQLQCFLFLSSAILLPGLWCTLWAHYNLGKRSEPLSSLKLEECLERRTELVRREYAPDASIKVRRQAVAMLAHQRSPDVLTCRPRSLRLINSRPG